MKIRVLSALLLATVLCGDVPANASNLKQLQKSAMSDQSPVCMLDEYSKQYNKMKLFGRERAHEEAMKWVRSVWKYADPDKVEASLSSKGFVNGVAEIRARN